MTKTKTVKIFVLILGLISMISIFAGCGAKSSSKNNDLPKLIIGTGMYEPYYYLDENGEPAGIDVEIAKEACRRIGYEPVFRQIDWLNKNSELENSGIDCVWTCFSMNSREDIYNWAGPYCYDNQVIAVLKDSDIYTLEDLMGKTVGVQMDSLPEKMFSEMADENIPQVENIFCLTTLKESISALRREYVSACIGHEAALKKTLEEMDVNYRILEEPIVVSKLGVAFRLSDTRGICEKLQKALDEMIDDGTIEKILVAYGLEGSGVKR